MFLGGVKSLINNFDFIKPNTGIIYVDNVIINDFTDDYETYLSYSFKLTGLQKNLDNNIRILPIFQCNKVNNNWTVEQYTVNLTSVEFCYDSYNINLNIVSDGRYAIGLGNRYLDSLKDNELKELLEIKLPNVNYKSTVVNVTVSPIVISDSNNCSIIDLNI